MTTSFHTESATIYTFPVGGRKKTIQHGEQSAIIARLPIARLQARVPDVCAAALGSSWYHEAAIVDVEPSRRP